MLEVLNNLFDNALPFDYLCLRYPCRISSLNASDSTLKIFGENCLCAMKLDFNLTISYFMRKTFTICQKIFL